jgi:hypothetical protein
MLQVDRPMQRAAMSGALMLALLPSFVALPGVANAQDASSADLCGTEPPPPISTALKLDEASLQQSATAEMRGDYAEVVSTVKPLAEAGNAQAQYTLAVSYDAGLGIGQDHQQAVHWYQLSAEQGYPLAEYNLGAHYAEGAGTSQDYAQAAVWLRKAAQYGVAMAQFGLARLYLEGQGVPKDYGEAQLWTLKAADQGLAEAQFTLFILYAGGAPGVPRDDVKALMWGDLALNRFTPREAARRQVAQRDRDQLAADLSPTARADAVKLEQAWLATHKSCLPTQRLFSQSAP